MAMRCFTSLLLLFIITACSTPQVTYQEKLPAKDMTYCLLGDSGNALPSQFAVAHALQKENCDRIFILGDLIYPDGIKNPDDPDLDKKFISVYEPLSKTGNKPSFSLIMGNHDYRGSVSSWKKVAKKHPWIFFPASYYLQKLNDICFIGLDTNLYLRPWLLTQAFRQMKWLASLGSDLKDCRFTVALAHHPYLSPVGHRPAEGFLKHFYEDKIIGKVNVLITGHDHILADIGVHKGTQLFISGAGGQHNHRPGYLVMKVSDQIRFQFKEVIME